MIAAAWLAWAVLALLTIAAIAVWVHRTKQLIAPLTICVATLAFYVLPRAAYLLGFERPPLTSEGMPLDARAALIAETLAVSITGLLAFLAAHRSTSAAYAGTTLRFSLPQPAPARALLIGIGLWAVSGGATLYLLASLGGLGNAIARQHEISQLLRGQEPVFELTRLMIVPTALLLVNERTGTSRRWVWLIALAATLALFPLGRRSLIVLAACFPVALYHLTVRRIPTRWFVLVAVLGATTLFSLSYIRLLGAQRLGKAFEVVAQEPALAVHFAFTANAELQVFDATTIIVRNVPLHMPYDYGAAIARVPFMVIPRAFWPGKPVTLGETLVSRYLPHVRTGYPPMATGDLYAAGGIFAVILGFACLGWVSRTVWEWHRRSRGAGNATLYLTFCFFVFDYTRVGDPSRTIWFFVIGFAALVFAFTMAAPPSKPAPTPGSAA